MSVTSHGPEPCASAYSAISACFALFAMLYYNKRNELIFQVVILEIDTNVCRLLPERENSFLNGE